MQLPVLLDVRALHAEVDRIAKIGRSSATGMWPAGLPKAKSGSEAASQLLEILLRWAQIICAKSGLAVRSWASSFADGQALCLLVSHLTALTVDQHKLYFCNRMLTQPLLCCNGSSWSQCASLSNNECDTCSLLSSEHARVSHISCIDFR